MTEFSLVLATARRACGLTQEGLAAAADVTQEAVSRYENGQREPDAEVLSRLARVLGVTTEFLNAGGRVRGGMAVDAHMRRRQTAKPTVWRQFEARLNMYRLHARMVYEEISVRAEQTLPRLDPVGCSRVIEEDFGTARVDGLSQWIDDYPVVLINSRAPTDRKRLTLAHELGHLVLHSEDVTVDVETETNAFAAEFLMPAEVIRPQLRTLTVGRLHDLKREWGVSMQALIERAHGLNLITAAQRTNLYKSLSARGWRTSEPVSKELPAETPSLTQSIGSALLAKGYSLADICQIGRIQRVGQTPPIPTLGRPAATAGLISFLECLARSLRAELTVHLAPFQP